MTADFSFNIDNLKVEDEVTRSPVVFPLSVLVCKTEFETNIDSISEFKAQVKKKLFENYSFRKPERKKFREGFLAFRKSDGSTLDFMFARETPVKVNYEADDLEIHEDRLRLINPSFSVKIIMNLKENEVEVCFFGGSDSLVNKALDRVNYCIRSCLRTGHRTIIPEFSKEDMAIILKNFGLNVEYVWIHPGENQKFMKIIEKNEGGELKKIPKYIVHAKLHGYHITGSPITIGLIEESGIHLKEIQGKLQVGTQKFITVRVSSTGKALFYIPEDIVGTKETVFDVGEKLYSTIAVERKGPKQVSMGEYLA